MKKTIIMLSMLIASIGNVYADLKTTIIGTPNYEEVATDVLYLEDGSAIIGGYTFTEDLSSGYSIVRGADIFILKVDAAGTIIWQKQLGDPNENDFMQDMILTIDPNTGDQEIVFVSSTRPENTLQQNKAHIFKFDLNGNMLNSNHYRENSAQNTHGDIFTAVTQVSNGDIIAVGVNNDEPNESAGLICVFDYAALTYNYHEVWNVYDKSDEFVEVTSNGNDVYITGFVFIDQSDKHDLRISRYQPGTTSGTMLYDRSYNIVDGTQRNNYGTQIYYKDGKLLAAGIISSDYNGMVDNVEFVATIDPDGSLGLSPGDIQHISLIDNNAGGTNPYANPANVFPVTSDRLITIEHPSSTYYEPVFNAAVSTIDAKISDINIGSGSSFNNSMLLSLAGDQSILDVDGYYNSALNDGELYLVGLTNGMPGAIFGKRDIYFVQATYDLIGNECPLDPYEFSFIQPTYTNGVVSTSRLTRLLTSVNNYNIQDMNMISEFFCGEFDGPPFNCNSKYTVGGSTSNPYNIEFDPIVSNSGFNYTWTEGGTLMSNSYTNFTHNFGGVGTYYTCMQQEFEGEDCYTCLNICVNNPSRTDKDKNPCNIEFKWVFDPSNPYLVTVTPIAGTGGPFTITWGDGTSNAGVTLSTGVTHNYSSAGSQTVCVSTASGACYTCLELCINDPSSPVILGKPTRISNEELTLNGMSVMSIHPNPTNYQTTLDLYSSEEKIVEVSLFDVSGRNVLKQTAQLKNGKNSIDIAMDKLNNGMYMLYINDGKHNIVEKVVKY